MDRKTVASEIHEEARAGGGDTQASGSSKLAPYAPCWFPGTHKPSSAKSLLEWDPATDLDAAFNRSRVPLAPREQHRKLNTDPNARARQAKTAACAEFYPTSGHPSQQLNDCRYYAFGFWQYVDIMVFWAGSASEGIIVPPNGPIIDAAHRNGVKVYGNVFFAPSGHGGKTEWVDDFVVGEGNAYPVADKLIQVAQYYGFDGWFINHEMGDYGRNKVRDLIRYARASNTVEFMWYDNKRVFDDARKDLLQHGGERVCDSVFIDYGWDGNVTGSVAKAKEILRSPYDLFFGWEVYKHKVSVPAEVCPDGEDHLASVALFATHSASNWKQKNDAKYKNDAPLWLKDFYAQETGYWSGSAEKKRKGTGHWIAEATPVRRVPFVSHFNTGHGLAHYHRGAKSGTSAWTNLSVQEVLPTRRWQVVAQGSSSLTPALDFTDAYHGGSCLRLTGVLAKDDPVDLLLYDCRLAVTSTTEISIRVKASSHVPLPVSALLAFSSNPTTPESLPLTAGATTNSGWTVHTGSLKDYTRRTVVQLGLRVASASTAASGTAYDLRIGQLAVLDGALPAPPAPAGLRVTDTAAVGGDRKALRLAWTPTADAELVHHYDVLRGDAWLGSAANDVFYVERLDRNDEDTTTLSVVAVGPDGTRSARSSTQVRWTS